MYYRERFNIAAVFRGFPHSILCSSMQNTFFIYKVYAELFSSIYIKQVYEVAYSDLFVIASYNMQMEPIL